VHLCRALTAERDRDTLTLLRRNRCFALLNLYPYTSGHCMVAPNVHVSDLEQLDEAALAEIIITARSLLRALRVAYAPHGFNVGFGVGAAAGAGIEEHLHIVLGGGATRISGRISETRVIPEDGARLRQAAGGDRDEERDDEGQRPQRRGGSRMEEGPAAAAARHGWCRASGTDPRRQHRAPCSSRLSFSFATGVTINGELGTAPR
jgi:ATP adenylyltransferase